MHARHAAPVLVLALLGCASTARSPSGAASPAAEGGAAHRPDFKGALEREVAPLPQRPVVLPDGAGRGMVEAAGAPSVEAGKDAVMVSIPLGTEEAIKCFVYPKAIDAGASLYRMVRAIGKEMKILAVETTDVAVVGENPAIYLDLLYQAPANAKAAGIVKMMVYARPDHPFLCTHDEVGYAKTFRRVTRGFAGALKTRSSQSSPRLLEVQVIRVDDRPIGFQRVAIFDGKDGMTVTQTVATTLLAKSQTEVASEDVGAGTVIDARGRLVQLDYASAIDGDLKTSVSAKRGAGAEYGYSGSVDGKAVSGKFRSRDRDGLASDLYLARTLRERLPDSRPLAIKLEQYVPSIDPTAPVDVSCKRGSEARGLVLTVKGKQFTGIADDAGLFRRLETIEGGHRLTQERVFVRGAVLDGSPVAADTRGMAAGPLLR